MRFLLTARVAFVRHSMIVLCAACSTLAVAKPSDSVSSHTAIASQAQAQAQPHSPIKTPHAVPLERIQLVYSAVGEENVTIDGKLDEAIWQQLPSLGEFATIEPDTLVPGRHPTHVKMFYTERGVYIAYDLHQPKDTLVARLSSRDQRDINRDGVYITFDSSGEGRYGYWFGITLGGSVQDGTVLPERRYTTNWDGPWWGATAETAHGWSAEMFIPWSIMSMPQREDRRNLGVYMSRQVAYLNERWAWPALPETKPQFISALNQLELKHVAPRQQYNLFPYSSVTVDDVNGETDYNLGADLFWRPSTDFQLAATLKPDFGSVEADDVIVNLSATETFFPEKRLFFLEGQDVFVATPRASDSTPTTLVNTRRIGGRAVAPAIPTGVSVPKSELGQAAALDGALKTTGQSGNLRYGFLAASEDDTTFIATSSEATPLQLQQDGRDFGVARIMYEDSTSGAARGLGWLSTAVVHPDGEAYVHSVDAHYLTADGQWRVDSQALYSNVDGHGYGMGKGEGAGVFTDIKYMPVQGKTHTLELDYFDKKININDLGYLQRNNIYGLNYIYQKDRSDINFARNTTTKTTLLQKWNTEGQSVKSAVFWDGALTQHNLNTWKLRFSYFPPRYEDLDSFGNGTFKITERVQAGIGFGTNSSKMLSAQVDIDRRGEEAGGYHIETAVALTYRPIDRLSTVFKVNHKDRDGWLLHSGANTMTAYNAEEWKYRWDFDFFFTARQQFRASFQWVGIRGFEEGFYHIPTRADDLIAQERLPGESKNKLTVSNVNLQLRYRWEIAPMSDLFVVYTKNGAGKNQPEVHNDFKNMFTDVYHNPSAEQLVVKLRYRLGS